MKAYIVWPAAVLFGPVLYLALELGEASGFTMGQMLKAGTVLAFFAAIALGIMFERKRGG